MDTQTAFNTLDARDWAAEPSLNGLWAVGPEQEDGSLMVLGMAPTMEEAVEMALRSANASK